MIFRNSHAPAPRGSVVVLIACLLSGAGAQARATDQGASGRIRVYVFTAVDASKPDDRAQKAREDSVRDLQELLQKSGSLLTRAETLEDAKLTIEVMSRAVEAVGQAVTSDQIDAQGKHRMQSGRSVGSHKLVVRLALPHADNGTLLTGADLSWRIAAKLVINQVQDWVRANDAR
jgi:hypothetical protein